MTGNLGAGYAVVAMVLLLLAAAMIFVILHLRPLNDSELQSLAARRRGRQVKAYFVFSSSEFRPNLDFKRRMASNGQFYNVREALSDFPRLAASLLKYKKHEWIIVGMERNREITLMWLNKGDDGTRVCLRLPFDFLLRAAKANGYRSLLIFHNHPNSDPSTYSCRQPSQTDLKSALEWSKILNRHGMNLIEFVCERGVAYRYWFSVADAFLPISEFTNALRSENGVSKGKNLSLHMELIF